MIQKVIEATYRNGELILNESLSPDLEGKKLRLIVEEVSESERLTPTFDSEDLQRLLRYAGAIRSGSATGADNEEIDADLAKAYANDF
jgi:hypothetical protein